MIQARSHPDDNLERLERATGLLQDRHGEFAHVLGRVVQLCEEHTDLPLWARLTLATEDREAFGREDADVLDRQVSLRLWEAAEDEPCSLR